MISVFFLCWAPFLSFKLAQAHGINLSDDMCNTIRRITLFLTWCHSLANPVLYGFMLRGFRQRAKRTVSVAMGKMKRMSKDLMTYKMPKKRDSEQSKADSSTFLTNCDH